MKKEVDYVSPKTVEYVLGNMFPNKEIVVSLFNNTTDYKILSISIDGIISAKQIITGGRFETLSEQQILDNSISIVESNLRIYEKYDKNEILKRSRTIMMMVDAEPTSFHKLDSVEKKQLMEHYDLKESDQERAKKELEREEKKAIAAKKKAV